MLQLQKAEERCILVETEVREEVAQEMEQVRRGAATDQMLQLEVCLTGMLSRGYPVLVQIPQVRAIIH